jgi:microsomal dipeptidase-like Zn-dependent dipeptidase
VTAIEAALAVSAIAALLLPGAAGGKSPRGGGSGAAAVRSQAALANDCFALASAASGKFGAIADDLSYEASRTDQSGATPLYLKPTGIGTYMLGDPTGGLMAVSAAGQVTRATAPGPPAEWAISKRGASSFSIASTADGRKLAPDPSSGRLGLLNRGSAGKSGRFEFFPGGGCTPFPEAQVGAQGTPFRGTNRDGTVSGFVDDHLHITADLRAGGKVIYGESFDPFGISEALGHDEDVHGPNGSLDITGNLLRTGQPDGTHDTHGWPTFTGWPTFDTFTHQQTYYVWLQRAWEAGERLIVAQVVDDQSICEVEPQKAFPCDETQSIVRQIQRLRALQDYVDAQNGGPGRGWFRIVTNPKQARRVIEQGKLAVVIGVESSNPLGCSEFQGVPQCDRDDIDRGLAQFHRLGVRSMFITHWTDNAFGGAALEGGGKGELIGLLQIVQTGQPFSTEPCPGPDEGDGQCNTKGLTDLGRYVVQQMMAKHMIIEADHLSQKSRGSVLEIAERNHYPLISSHTGTGGEWTPDQLRRLYALGGLASVTLRTAPQLVSRILQLRDYRSLQHDFGVSLGTDTGGFASQPAPRPDAQANPLRYPFTSYLCHVRFDRQRTGQRSFDLNIDGVAHYGLIADLLADVQQQPGGEQALRTLFGSAEAYLQMWGRAY